MLKSAAEVLAADVGEEVKPAPRSKKKSAVKASDGFDLFKVANDQDTIAILDRLNIAHSDSKRGKMAMCPGCHRDGSLVCDSGGLKCLFDTCSSCNPNPERRGYRANVDIVALVENLSDVEAAKRICEWNSIKVPEFKKTNGHDTDFGPTEYDELHAQHVDDVVGGDNPVSDPPKPFTLTDIIEQWTADGPLIRVPTGIEPLDRMTRGGFPIPWRVKAVGAPGAGKTAVGTIIANNMMRAAEQAGLCVGILGVDEEPEDLAVRLVQIAGFSLDESEERDPRVLAEMKEAVAGLRVRLYDDNFTIESAAADLAAWAKAEGRMAALFLDSLHAVRSTASAAAQNPRESVEANVRAIRSVSTKLRMLVFSTVEANRASFRTDDAADTTNDLAAGAESRSVEYGAQTQLMLRTPKDHPDVIHVRVPKNRRADRGEFWLRLDRMRHTVTECADPNADPAAVVAKEDRKQEAGRAAVARDAEALSALLVRHPDGLGERELRAELKANGYRWGVDRLDAARSLLGKGHKGVKLTGSKDGKRMVSRVVPDTFDTEEK